MAADNKAGYFCIGLTVFLGMLAIAGTLVYIGGLRGHGDELLVESYYDGEVGGLSARSVVNYRGVKIGEVREVNLLGSKYKVEGSENTRIYILMAFNDKLLCQVEPDRRSREEKLRKLISLGLRSTVTVNAITGIAKVECDFYPELPQPAEPAWKSRHLVMPSQPSMMEDFSESLAKVLDQIKRMDLNAFWSNINASAESISATTASSQHLLESYQPELERTVKNLEETTSALRETSEQLRRDPSVLLRGSSPAPLPETDR